MKLKKKIIFICFGLMFFTGCFTKNNDIVSVIKKNLEKNDSYNLTGILEVINNENIYKYDIDVSYKKDDNFRVSLKNKTNYHEQIILKNDDGVFVLTPSLNKSFKFQSEWPYNNSQSYLLQSLLNDIENDKSRKIEKNKKGYIITSNVEYSNNKNLKKQKIYVDEKGIIQKVEVIDDKNIVKIKMLYKKIDMRAKFAKKYFDLTENMNMTNKSNITVKEIEDKIYPMYMPKNTYLENEKTVSIENGERVILTFAGDNPFMLIEETASIDNKKTVIPVNGDVELLNDTIGCITEGMASWISNGIEYYAVSEKMDNDELMEVINSISTLPVGK